MPAKLKVFSFRTNRDNSESLSSFKLPLYYDFKCISSIKLKMKQVREMTNYVDSYPFMIEEDDDLQIIPSLGHNEELMFRESFVKTS